MVTAGAPVPEAPAGGLNLSSALLVGANLVPLFGVLLWDWPMFDVMALYWAENVIAGVLTVVRMVIASPVAGTFMGAFFCVHYGMFCFVHGIFVAALFGGSLLNEPQHGIFGLGLLLDELATPALRLAILSLAISHGASLFIHGAERNADSAALNRIMRRPYGRMAVLHVTLLFGGFAVFEMGAPVLALIPMVLFKIGADLFLHRRANRSAVTPD